MERSRSAVAALAVILLVRLVQPAQAVTIAWPGVIDVDVPGANWAYPDAYARYYFTPLEIPAGTSITLTGQSPDSRFFSFETYTQDGYSADYIPDFQVVPDLPGQNPFANPAALPGTGTYTLQLVRPDEATGAPNEIVTAPPSPDGLCRGTVTYRMYVTTDLGDIYGGVPLPSMTLNTPAGSFPLPQSPVHLPITPGLPLPFLYNPPGMDEPMFFKPDSAAAPLWPNSANAYLGVELDLMAGRYFVIQGKSPLSPDTLAGESPALPGQEVRYWSLSTNDNTDLLPVIHTLRDDEVVLDANGYYTLVIARAEDMPTHLGSGITPVLIDLADFNDRDGDGLDEMVLTFRHMLGDPDFPFSVQNAPAGADWLATAASMGEYYPRLTVVTTPEPGTLTLLGLGGLALLRRRRRS